MGLQGMRGTFDYSYTEVMEKVTFELNINC